MGERDLRHGGDQLSGSGVEARGAVPEDQVGALEIEGAEILVDHGEQHAGESEEGCDSESDRHGGRHRPAGASASRCGRPSGCDAT